VSWCKSKADYSGSEGIRCKSAYEALTFAGLGASPKVPTMILQYNNPPSKAELVELIKRTFVSLGYDTPEKRQKWHDQQSPIAIFAELKEDIIWE